MLRLLAAAVAVAALMEALANLKVLAVEARRVTRRSISPSLRLPPTPTLLVQADQAETAILTPMAVMVEIPHSRLERQRLRRTAAGEELGLKMVIRVLVDLVVLRQTET
jgi:hypothetical protein